MDEAKLVCFTAVVVRLDRLLPDLGRSLGGRVMVFVRANVVG